MDDLVDKTLLSRSDIIDWYQANLVAKTCCDTQLPLKEQRHWCTNQDSFEVLVYAVNHNKTTKFRIVMRKASSFNIQFPCFKENFNVISRMNNCRNSWHWKSEDLWLSNQAFKVNVYPLIQTHHQFLMWTAFNKQPNERSNIWRHLILALTRDVTMVNKAAGQCWSVSSLIWCDLYTSVFV